MSGIIPFSFSQVINAALTLAARPQSKVAQDNMDVFKDQWEKQVRILTEAVDDITSVDDFLSVSGKMKTDCSVQRSNLLTACQWPDNHVYIYTYTQTRYVFVRPLLSIYCRLVNRKSSSYSVSILLKHCKALRAF